MDCVVYTCFLHQRWRCRVGWVMGFVFSFGYLWMVDIVRIRAGRGMERSMGLYIKCNIRLFRFDSSHICSLLLRHLMRSIGENTCRHLSARPRSYYLETPSRFDGALPLRALGLMDISPPVSKGTSLRVRVVPGSIAPQRDNSTE
jgi:hypothetical protein